MQALMDIISMCHDKEQGELRPRSHTFLLDEDASKIHQLLDRTCKEIMAAHPNNRVVQGMYGRPAVLDPKPA
jgi:hypothetical protein